MKNSQKIRHRYNGENWDKKRQKERFDIPFQIVTNNGYYLVINNKKGSIFQILISMFFQITNNLKAWEE